jgi:hypothetical protein
MARGGRAEFNINATTVLRNLEVLMHHVERGTKKATKAAAEEILQDSISQVPRETDTLAGSVFYEIHGSYSNFSATVGYGKGDPINPKTGQPVSEYMVVVHEDLSANHPTGKAKFLEDPVRKYKENAIAKAAAIIRGEIG